MTLRCYWLDQFQAGDPDAQDFQYIWTATRAGANSWNAKSLFYSMVDNPPPDFDPTSDFIDGFSTGVNIASQARASVPFLLSLSSSAGTVLQWFYIPASGSPVAINSVALPNVWDFFTHSQGPFFFNNAWWVVGYMGGAGSESNQSPGPANMSVWKNTNTDPAQWTSGNWTRMDEANEPGSGTTIFEQRFTGETSKFHFLVNTSGSGGASVYELIEFDFATGTWGTLHDAITPGQNPLHIQGLYYTPADGRTHLFYGPSRYAYLDSGTWTQDILVGDGTAPFTASNSFIQALVDPDGTTLHTIYSHINDAAYQKITSGGAMGTVSHFANNTGQFNFGHGMIFDDAGVMSLAICCDYTPDLTSDLTPAVFVTPLANPDFTGLPELIAPYTGDKSTCTYLTIESELAPVTLCFKGHKVYEQ